MIYKSENAPKESEKGCYHAVSLSGGKDSTATANMVSTTYRRYAAVQQPSGWKP